MIKFEWSDSLSLGNDRIDGQHKEIIKNANDLLMACREGVGVGKVPDILLFLDEHIREHFHDEEELQRSVGYPGLESHKAEHRNFAKVFGTLKSELDRNGATLALAIKTSSYVIGWLKEHFNGSDREFGRYMALNKDKTR